MRSVDVHKQALKVERPFYALDSRWATGAGLRNETRIAVVRGAQRLAGQGLFAGIELLFVFDQGKYLPNA